MQKESWEALKSFYGAPVCRVARKMLIGGSAVGSR